MDMIRVGDRPIVRSLMDVDFYKFPMEQLMYHRHPDIPVEFAFINRTKSVRLGECIDAGELRENLEDAKGLRYTRTGRDHISGTDEYDGRMFDQDYINYVEGFQLSDFELGNVRDGQIDLKFHGHWPEASHWETIALSIVNELFTKYQMKGMTKSERDAVFKEGVRRLERKIEFLARNPGITVSDFSTRRRASRNWQDYVVSRMSTLPESQFRGTSNTWLAMKYNKMPIGTNAHEMPMVYSGIYWNEDERYPLVSQRKFLEDWEDEYGLALSIFLPDTYGSDFFFRNIVTHDQLGRWKGSRHDSGDPFEYGEKRIAEYERVGIDPREKLIVFADGLDMAAIDSLYRRFAGRIGITFGWGTNLGNDIGLKTLSIIVKAVYSNGHPLVKLSDNIEKATGDPAAVARMKRLVGYDVQYAKECRY